MNLIDIHFERQNVIDEDGVLISKEEYKENYYQTLKVVKDERVIRKADGGKKKIIYTTKIVRKLGEQCNLFR